MKMATVMAMVLVMSGVVVVMMHQKSVKFAVGVIARHGWQDQNATSVGVSMRIERWLVRLEAGHKEALEDLDDERKENQTQRVVRKRSPLHWVNKFVDGTRPRLLGTTKDRSFAPMTQKHEAGTVAS